MEKALWMLSATGSKARDALLGVSGDMLIGAKLATISSSKE